MEIQWHRGARHDLEEAAEYYERRREGLGAQFLTEVESAIGLIQQFPNGWPQMTQKTRRVRTRRFPYGIVYQIRGNSITILAVMHLARSPGYWRKREE
jgi:plasmid stabilization system protein ParE